MSQKAWEDLQVTRRVIGIFVIRLKRCLSIVSRDLVNKMSKWAHDGLVGFIFCQENRNVSDFPSK